MDITVDTRGDVQVATLCGKLDSAAAPAAQEKLAALVTTAVKLVLDMKDCDYVSSAGLRVLLWTAKSTARAGGKAVVAGLASDIREVMEMTGFGSLFASYDSVDDAIAALQEG